MAAKPKIGGECLFCHSRMQAWHAAFTSECSHTFHIGCISGFATCPSCTARWNDTPVVPPAPRARPFCPIMCRPSWIWEPPTFQQPSPSSRSSQAFVLPLPPPFVFPGLEPAPPVSSQRTLQSEQPPPEDQCFFCHGDVGRRGQATVTFECRHSFHLRCITGRACPVCSTPWSQRVTVGPSSPVDAFASPSSPSGPQRPRQV